jgi:hypothetical protein
MFPILEMDFTDEEIKVALFSILDDKTPRPNDFTYLFFFLKVGLLQSNNSLIIARFPIFYTSYRRLRRNY